MGKPKTDKNVLDNLCVAMSTLFGVGYVPLLGGTAGSVCGLFVFLLFNNSRAFFIFTIIVVIVSFFVSHYAEIIFKEKDSKKIIIDDFAGMLISFLFIPKTPLFIVAGFIFFRAFDFFKVYPANKIEHLHGGLGVTGDDVVAGLYANGLLQVLKFVLKSGS